MIKTRRYLNLLKQFFKGDSRATMALGETGVVPDIGNKERRRRRLEGKRQRVARRVTRQNVK